jgi:hypothetical protein
MSAEIVDVSAGVVTARVSGTLTQTALSEMQNALAEVIRSQGKVRILVLAENFAGWERGGAWDDFSFQAQYDPSIEKMAIVGDQRWEDLALIFTAKDLRRFPIEYFTPDELGKARAWLGA